jgi:hypothetical protein
MDVLTRHYNSSNRVPDEFDTFGGICGLGVKVTKFRNLLKNA